ncbi:hypothetical protein V6259_02555 [Marinomonas sp. TI.3.20]|uniref:hypothetical protein n=1 Tax=Marinomonas sp. TI.3.20 TaxID=3121296 RepID=UPI00311E176E
MPIEVKQMTIRSNITANTTNDSGQEKPQKNTDECTQQSQLQLHDGEQFQTMKTLFNKLKQAQRER